jgi:HEAT repeat protein
VSESADQTCSDKLHDAIKALVFALSSGDGMLRQTVRQGLVALGETAVPALISALRDPNTNVRWEAAKALSEIASPQSAEALVGALEDRNFGVRWLAAEGLIVLGRAGLAPLAQALIRDPESEWLREGAHHVLRVLANRSQHELVAPLLGALEGFEAALDVVPQAYELLDALRPEPEEHMR